MKRRVFLHGDPHRALFLILTVTNMFYPSHYPPVTIPDHDVYHHLFELKERKKDVDVTIFIDGTDHRKMTVAELHRYSKRLSNALRTRHQAKSGQVAAIYSFNDVSRLVTMEIDY
jgi:hypothetical protein